MAIQFDEEQQKKRLSEIQHKEEEKLAEILSGKYGLPYLNLATVPINLEALRVLPEVETRRGTIAPFDIVGKKLSVGLLSPNKDETKETLKKLKEGGYELSLFLVSEGSLEKAWQRYKDLSYSTEVKAGALEVSNEEIKELLKTIGSIGEIARAIETTVAEKKLYRVSRILEVILSGALKTGASDVHLEAEEGYVRIRYRLDGVLQDVSRIDTKIYSLILSRIKIISGLKLNVRDAAQDGRFSIKTEEADIEIRTSVLPGAYDESLVLRVLNPRSIRMPLEEIGIPEPLSQILTYEIRKPQGMVLTTGPTGSGKTTTLYGFLRKIHTSEVKIITIEDPIEYHLPGIVQTQVEPEKGYTFLTGLRSTLRQDPDIIMVGEIRDNETAAVAVNAALTGHLVFSTLHTNNAAGTFPRLIDLGVNPKVITSALNIALAQRLLRRLCSDCRKKVRIEGRAKEVIERVIRSLPKGVSVPQRESVYEAGGCPLCNNTGYRGRIGVFEGILPDAAVEKIILANPSEREVRRAARPQAILTMLEDGIIKVLTGVTSFSEVERVVDITEK